MSTNNRKVCRQGRRCDLRALADAIFCLVHHSDLDAKQIAERLGVRYSYLLDSANADRDKTQFQARLIVPLTIVTGRYDLLDYLERAVGRVAFTVPAAGSSDLTDVTRAAGEAMCEFAEDMDCLGRALADGRVTQDEADAFTRDAHETMAAIAHLAALVSSKVATPFTVRRRA